MLFPFAGSSAMKRVCCFVFVNAMGALGLDDLDIEYATAYCSTKMMFLNRSLCFEEYGEVFIFYNCSRKRFCQNTMF